MKEALSRFKDTVKGEIRKALKVLRNDEDVEEMDTSKKDLANQEKKLDTGRLGRGKMNTYNRISFTVMLMLDQCPEATAEIFYWYSVCGMIAMIVHWLLLIDMTIFSTQLSAFLLVVGHVLGEVKQFLTALTFLLLLFGSTISILCDRQCGDDGGNFNDMWNAIISLFSITVGLYQGDFREIQGDPMLLTMIYLFLLVSVVLLLNLLIAQLNQTYEYINKDSMAGKEVTEDVLGFARLNRASLVVHQTPRRGLWAKDLRLDEKREFDEGDLGLAGCIQSYEPSGLHRQNEEPIKRYGGTTASEVRLAHIEYLLEKALRRKGLDAGMGGYQPGSGHSSRSILSSGGTGTSNSQAATVKLLLDANGDDLARLSHSAAVPVLSRLAEKIETSADKLRDLTAARRRFLITLPVLLGEKKDRRRDSLPLTTLFSMHKDVTAIKSFEKELLDACEGAVESISELIGTRVRHVPEEVSLEMLPELLSLPLNWRAVAEPLADALSPLLKCVPQGQIHKWTCQRKDAEGRFVA
eukprot:s988_g8.t1